MPLLLVAQFAASLAVTLGIVIGIVQLRNVERQRREQAAVLLQSFQNPEFNRALRVLWALPDGTAAAHLKAHPDQEQAAILAGTTLETIGVLVYRRMVPLEIVDDLMGDAIVNFWPKLQDWVLTLRREQSRESVYEWFQWLVDRLNARERRRGVGAHERYKAWRA